MQMVVDGVNCVVCAKEAGYNRALIGPSGEIRAGLCRGCESRLFGSQLAVFEEMDEQRCAFCTGAAGYRLGKWRPSHEARDGDIHVDNRIDRTDGVVWLCRTHVRALRTASPSDSAE